MHPRRVPVDDRGSSPIEFVLVGTMLTLLTLAVLQLALAVYVRNVVHDAAVEGAYYAARADTTLHEGVERCKQAITRAVGSEYTGEVVVATSGAPDREVVEIRVRTTLPVIGLLGVPHALEVHAHAPRESFGEE
ncbi:TadE/TadG family type IV pilus assembly protein [Microbacterium sp. XT11]|uniref:TadE/TadG family type IV pilus assembly protein n=1 Tax=Microbacterium sp. XT11 TaxID=367477 RepID=UPI0008348485|nr:TadE family protein [Microbacterium sp. XT11]